MKKPILILLALTAQICAAQYYTLHTNLYHTNVIAGLTTNTYAGTNFLDFTRYREGLLSLSGQSANTGSNFIGQSWQVSRDSTNWDSALLVSFQMQSHGLTFVAASTPVDWTTYGYLRPYQVWNTNSADFTNFSTGVWTKSVPRN